MIVSVGKKTRGCSVMSSNVLKCVTLMTLHFVSCMANANPDAVPSGILLPYQTLYVSGVEAYMKQRWKECVTLVSKAITDHRSYRDQLNTCRYSCKNAGHLKVDETNFLENIYLDAAQKQSVCIKNCTEKVFPNRRPYRDLSSKLREVELHFQNLDPYDYLQMCAFKAQQFQLAFSAAFTFAIARPNHPYAGFNLEFYRKIAGEKVDMFKNLELKLHQELRHEAVEAYENSDWIGATEKFESSLGAYFKADEECDAECDSLLDDDKFSEFHRKVAEAKFKEEARYYMSNHWLKLLNCRESCTKKLATVNGVHMDRFLLDHFHYLQYCYYKAGNPSMAARNVASFLLFNPNDPNQTYNKIFYKQQGLASEKDFVPRQDAQKFYEKKAMDLKLKKLAEEEFLLHRGKRNLKPFTFKSPEIYNPPSNESNASFQAFLRSIGVTLTSQSPQLGGQKRVVADGLANTQDCQNLVELANIGHSEKINRVTVSKAAEMVRDGKASATQVGTLMQVSDKARHFLENFYNLKVPLLFQRTQLTYREDEANLISGSLTLYELDGCYNNKSIFCIGNKGRDFIAYIYLDDGRESSDNGTFHYAAEGEQSSASIEPKQGRMFALTTEDKHHLDKVNKGHSYALIIWFTLSPADQELDHAEARTILRIVEEGASRTSKISLASLDFMKSKHYSLSFDEEDLNGPERFAADGLASEEECRALIRLTNSFGSAGSGYGSGFSHTRHESFTGVTVDAATEVGGYIGDGYEGRDPMFPHTKHEVFEGLNVLDAAELAQQHKVSAEDVQLYLRLSNDMRELTRKVLVGDGPLYFSFTHLVCRTALNDENLDRTDLSHPIHSDNCIIQDDNTCKKVRPAYTERDYSAILYLNDDFFGGDFFFAHQNMSVQSRVKPKCGRVVSFNSGHYHGVKPVLSGQRCAVAIWFTLDPEYDETSHLTAQDILNNLEKEGRKNAGGGSQGHLRVEL